MFIDPNDIDLLCNASKFDNSNKTEAGCNEQGNQLGGSESKCNGRSTFKEKTKNIWGKVKEVILVGVDALKTMATFAKAVTVFVKCFRKMKGVFA